MDDLGPSADFMESLRDRVGMVMIIMMNIMAMVIINIMTMITMMIAGANIMEYLQDGVALMMLVVTMMVVVRVAQVHPRLGMIMMFMIRTRQLSSTKIWTI